MMRRREFNNKRANEYINNIDSRSRHPPASFLCPIFSFACSFVLSLSLSFSSLFLFLVVTMNFALERYGADSTLEVAEARADVHLALDGLFVIAKRTVEYGIEGSTTLMTRTERERERRRKEREGKDENGTTRTRKKSDSSISIIHCPSLLVCRLSSSYHPLFRFLLAILPSSLLVLLIYVYP